MPKVDKLRFPFVKWRSKGAFVNWSLFCRIFSPSCRPRVAVQSSDDLRESVQRRPIPQSRGQRADDFSIPNWTDDDDLTKNSRFSTKNSRLSTKNTLKQKHNDIPTDPTQRHHLFQYTFGDEIWGTCTCTCFSCFGSFCAAGSPITR